MVSAETLLSDPDWNITLTVHTDASDKQLGVVISQNNKPVEFFSIRLSNPQRKYNTTDKERLEIFECLKQFPGILFGYEINVFSDHKNMVYAATLIESQRVTHWRLIFKYFGPNIQNIYGVDNIVSDTLNRLPYIPVDNYEPITSKS